MFKSYYKGGIFDKTLAEHLEGVKGPWRQRLHEMFGADTTLGDILARYDAAARYVDSAIKNLVESLEELNLLDDTLIIVTSDHGESLGEHSIYFDHHGLYDVSIRVPLLFYPPLLGSEEVTVHVQHIDLLPTILDLLGIKEKIYVEGISLVPIILDEDKFNSIREFIYAEESYTQRKFTLRDHRFKYIISFRNKDAVCRYCGVIHGGVEELYDLKRDPNESINVIEDHPDIAREFRERLVLYIKKLMLAGKIQKVRGKIAHELL